MANPGVAIPEVGGEVYLVTLDLYAEKNNASLEFAGKDLYDEGESNEFLTVKDDCDRVVMRFIWSGHVEAFGAVYKRIE